MRLNIITRFIFSLICLSVTSLAYSQVATGVYPFGTFDHLGVDSINVGNLNSHLTIPLLNKPGRGIPFSYSLSYDSAVWTPVLSNGTVSWAFAQANGWRGVTEIATGYVGYNIATSTGRVRGQNGIFYTCPTTTYSGFTYHDAFGVAHPFAILTQNQTTTSPCNGTSTPNGSATAADGSGYSMVVTYYNQVKITDRLGHIVNAPSNTNSGPGTITDNNGNQLTTDGQGHFTDTLGKTALTVTTPSGSQQLFTYTDTNGNSQNVTVTYSPYTVKTAFGCSGVTDYGPTSTPLISSIEFPDGTSYAFTYESTPGTSGDVTGRLASLTLPSGGTIAYSYGGANNGISCATGSPNVLTRKLTNDAASNTRTYTFAATGVTSTTTVQDGLANSLIYSFIAPSGTTNASGPLYETQRQIYNGAASGTPVLNQLTCYNANTSNCQTTQPLQPFSKVDTYATVNGLVQNGATIEYDAYGDKTGEIDYDYGTATARGPVLRYNYYLGFGTQAYIGLYTLAYVADANGNYVSYTTYAYDQTTPTPTSGLPQHIAIGAGRGNVTTVTSTSGTATASSTYTYDDAGQRLTSTDPAGNHTSYTYDVNYDAYITKITYPAVAGVTQTESASYDFNTGLPLTSTNNGKQISYSYNAVLRPLTIQYPDGGKTTYTYNLAGTYPGTPATSSVSVLHAGSTSITQTKTYDWYGRTLQTSLTDDIGNDLVNYTYDANSNVASVTTPYRSGATLYFTKGTYDVLGRLLTQTQPDCQGSTCSVKTWSPLGNTITTTDEAGKQREQFTDGLGRITKVLEPTSTGALTLETDYLYNQNYSSGTYQTIVNQKGGSANSGLWRTRTLTHDMFGGLVSSNEPESGLISYTYGPTRSAFCAGNIALPCTRTDQRGVITTYTYDALNRTTGMSYTTTGTTSAATTSVAYLYDQSSYNGLTITNGVGNRTGMTDASGTTAYSFDTMNRMNGIRKTIAGATAQAGYTYNLDGTVNTLKDFAGNLLTYTYTGAGLQKSVADSGGHTYASAAQYNAAGQLISLNHQLTTSSATLARQLSYNSRLQPQTIQTTSNGATIQNLTIGYPAPGQNNGDVSTITNGLDSSRNQHYGYDSLNRLSSGGDVSHWGEQYTYDSWGNMIALTLTQGSGNAFNVGSANNSNQLPNLSYDASGNVTHDEFSNTLVYNAESRISSSGSASYTYDGDGYRVVKTDSAGTSLYWPTSVSGIIDESNSAATAFASQVYLDGLKVWSSDTSGNGRFLFQDHLGSTRITANSAGSVLDDIDYRPFGNIVANYGSAPSDNHYTFTGYESDAADTSTNYATFRNESSYLGRFNRPDPYLGSYDFTNPQSFNRYSYAVNNPLIYTDPAGLDYIDANGDLCLQGNDDDYDANVDCLTWAPIPGVQGLPGGFQGNSITPPEICIQQNAVAQNVVSALSGAAQFLNQTVGFGVGGSAGVGSPFGVGWGISGSLQLLVSPDGTAGVAFTYTYPLVPQLATPGAGALFGFQVTENNNPTFEDNLGGGLDAGAILADEVGVGYDISNTGQTLTLGFGAGGYGHGLSYTNTIGIPFCPVNP